MDRPITALDLAEAQDLTNDNSRLHIVNPDRAAAADRNRALTRDQLAILIPDGSLPPAKLTQGFALAGTVIFTSTGTFTKATYPWLRAVRVRAVGGGGAGGGVNTGAFGTAAGSGGGGGGYAEAWVLEPAIAASVTVTIGAGGDGVVSGPGNPGGMTAFGPHAAASGGEGGGTESTSTVPLIIWGTDTLGGAPNVGNILQLRGSPGEGGAVFNIATGSARSRGGTGGDSMFGAGGRGRHSTAAGNRGGYNAPAHSFGGGGGGAAQIPVGNAAQAGGNGRPGIVIVELYA